MQGSSPATALRGIRVAMVATHLRCTESHGAHCLSALLDQSVCAVTADFGGDGIRMNTKCTNKRIGKLIGMYEFGALEDSRRGIFLNHLVDCEYCHNQVYSMGPIT